MSVVNVTFDIPQWIKQGLANNQYERFGGIIRETNSGKIVAHLRANSSYINEALSSMYTTGSFASLLNLGVSIVGFTLILSKLNEVENRILNIENSLQRIEFKINNINSKIDLSFKSELIGGLNQLNKAILVNDPILKKELILSIVYNLEKTKEVFKDLLTKSSENLFYDYENLIEFYQLYILSYLSYVGLGISYLELEQLNISKEIFQESYNLLTYLYEDIILVSNQNDNLDELEEDFISAFKYFGLERLTTDPSSLLEFLFVGEKLKPDHENIELRNQEKIKHIKKIPKEVRAIILSLESFLEEIKYVQELKLNWSIWKEIKPVKHNSKAEYMYIIPSSVV